MGVVMDTKITPISGIFARELRRVLPNLSSEQVNVVYTFQKSKHNTLDFFYPQQDENLYKKDFYEFSKRLGDRLDGYWWDFIDPQSGYPVRQSQTSSSNPIEDPPQPLNLQAIHFEYNSIIPHPLFDTEVFVSTFVTDAPEDVIKEKLREINDLKS